MMLKAAPVLIAFTGVLLPACISPWQEGRIYRNDAPSVSRLQIGNAAALSSEISAEIDGSPCHGRISRTDATDNSVSPDSTTNATSDKGIGILICANTKVLRCQFVHRMVESYAFGECVDQHNSKYTVLF